MRTFIVIGYSIAGLYEIVAVIVAVRSMQDVREFKGFLPKATWIIVSLLIGIAWPFRFIINDEE